MCSEIHYIESATDLRDRITRIETVITALEAQLLIAAGNGDLSSYSLDDGQVKIQSQYRSPSAIADGLFKLDTLRQRLINQLNGRQTVLRGWQGLR